MIIEFNGKSLSDSCDVFIYYSKLCNKELFADLICLQKLFTKTNGKIETDSILKDPTFFDFFKNLYFAGRCAFEDKLVPLSVLKNELSIKSLMNLDFYNKMYEFIGGMLPEENKKKS